MKNQLLKAISEMPSSAAYYMGRRDGYAEKIEETLITTSVENIQANPHALQEFYWWFDTYNDNFVSEMGWL